VDAEVEKGVVRCGGGVRSEDMRRWIKEWGDKAV
jgi:predicted sulfurtransferase